jgi:HSP20 family protein
MMLRFDFPKVFEDLVESQMRNDYVTASKTFAAMDVTESEQEYVAVSEMPGVKKEDVKISFEKNVLTVQGQRKPYEVPDEAKVLLNEIRVRDFSRSIQVPGDIDADKISAELENGILRVVLPKGQSARVRTIPIK